MRKNAENVKDLVYWLRVYHFLCHFVWHFFFYIIQVFRNFFLVDFY